MTNRVLVLNGPNLRRLGVREPDKYGTTSFDELAALCRDTGRRLDLSVEVRQTDDEAEMVHWVHEAADERVPIVLNPAAFTHYSYSLRDALAQRTAPLSRSTSPTPRPARIPPHLRGRRRGHRHHRRLRPHVLRPGPPGDSRTPRRAVRPLAHAEPVPLTP